MHSTSGHWRLGFFLAFTTATLWGILPIALKVLLTRMDAMTITWYRFLFATACIAIYLLIQTQSRHFLKITRFITVLLGIAIAGLTSNYIFYLKGLELSDPNSAQVVIQLAPILLLFGGLIIFRERFNKRQWLGVFLFTLGIVLFFNPQLRDLNKLATDYQFGVLLVVLAAITWAAYALAQKQLLSYFSSNQIMLCIYVAGSLLFFPAAVPEQVLLLDKIGWWLLAFCSINTVMAYGCFAEALNHLEASRVSAILAITPLLTIVFMSLISQDYSEYIHSQSLNQLSLAGASLMVCGSMLTALGKQHK